MPTKQKGYTLAEILIVVSIIVVLGLAILVGINPMAQIFRGYDSRRKADLNKIKIALEAYYSDHDCYPNFPLEDDEGHPSYACNSDVLSPYLASIPCDPNSNKPYTLYLLPTESTCAQQYVVYAQINSIFDSQANKINQCPKTIAVKSSDITNVNVIEGCTNSTVDCPNHWGCINGSCVLLAEDAAPPPCKQNNFCESTCDNGTKCPYKVKGVYKFECVPN